MSLIDRELNFLYSFEGKNNGHQEREESNCQERLAELYGRTFFWREPSCIKFFLHNLCFASILFDQSVNQNHEYWAKNFLMKNNTFLVFHLHY